MRDRSQSMFGDIDQVDHDIEEWWAQHEAVAVQPMQLGGRVYLSAWIMQQ